MGDSYQGEKVIPKERRITPKVQKRISFLPSERLCLKSNSLLERERPSRVRPSLPKEKERYLKIPTEEKKNTNVPLTLKINPQVKTFSFNEKETSEDLSRREEAHKCVLKPKRSNFQVKTFSFKKKTFEGPKRRE